MSFSILRLLIVMAIVATWGTASRWVYSQLPENTGGAGEYIIAAVVPMAAVMLTVALGVMLWSLAGAIEILVRRK